MKHIQYSFSAGEINSFLANRSDLEKYNIGLLKCKNFLLNLSGAVSRRTGTRYIATTKIQDKNVILLSFQVSNIEGYVIEFGDKYCRFFKNKGQVILELDDVNDWQTATDYIIGDFVKYNNIIYYCIENHTSNIFNVDVINNKWIEQNIYEIPSPYNFEDLAELKFIQSNDVVFITHQNYPTYELTRYGNTNFKIEIFDYDIPPFMLSNYVESMKMNVSAVNGSGVNLTFTDTPSSNYFETGHIGSYFKIYHNIDGQNIKKVFSSTGQSTSIQAKGTWRIRSFEDTAELDVSVEQSLDNGTTWKTLRIFNIVNSTIDTFGVVDDYCLLRLNCTSHNADGTLSLTTEPFSQAGIIKITSITSPTVAVGDVIRQFASISQSDDWAESCWSNFRGFPSCATFFQDRLCFANTKTEKQTIWMSKTGDYYNFDISDSLVDSDKISIQLASRKLNGINNLIYLNNIIALTTGDEWLVGASDNGAVSPTNIGAQVQGSRGSSIVAPVIIGNKIIYLQPSGAILRNLGYDYNSNTFTGEQINIFSEHLFKNKNIIDLDYMEEPNSTIYLVRDDGKIITCMYMKEQEINGYSIQETQGNFESISVIKSNNKNEVWCVVKRGDNRFVEVFEEYSEDVYNQWFLDSALNYDGVATDTFTGLEHLEGYEVDVLADGNIILGLNVVEGEVVLPYEAEKVIIGLRYTSDLETLPIIYNFQNGTTKTNNTRIPNVSFVFENSRNGKVCDPDLQEYNEIINTREYMDLPIGLYSGQYKIEINSSWGLDKRIFFRQENPLPANILAIITDIDIGG